MRSAPEAHHYPIFPDSAWTKAVMPHMTRSLRGSRDRFGTIVSSYHFSVFRFGGLIPKRFAKTWSKASLLGFSGSDAFSTFPLVDSDWTRLRELRPSSSVTG